MTLPDKWKFFFVGRIVNHPSKSNLQGVVKYADSTRLGQPNPQGLPGAAITSAFCVEWEDGTEEVMEDTAVAAIATDEFADEDWVVDRIRKLQKHNWDEAKADADTSTKPAQKPKASKTSAAVPKRKPVALPNGTVASPKNGTDTVCISLQELKRRRSDAMPSPSQQQNKRPKKKDSPPEPVIVRRAPPDFDHNSTAGKTPTNTKAGAATATSPRRIALPSSVDRNHRMPTARITAPMLHVKNLTSSKVKGKQVFQFDEISVEGTQYRVYCKDVIVASRICYRAKPTDGKPKDMTIHQWKVMENYDAPEDDEFLVDCIAAERTSSKGVLSFLIKYTGFELDPGPENWLKLAEVDETEAYDRWINGERDEWRSGIEIVKSAAGGKF